MRCRILRTAAALVPLILAAGCRQDMHNQPKYKPLAATDFFGDGRSARPWIEGTVARGHMRLDPARFTGKVNGQDVTDFPFPITRADLGRGEERFNIYCSPCHGRTGDGQGIVVKRGFRNAANYHTEKLRRAPVGHFFDVVTNGFGAMASYASRVPVDDRWRIIAYIRVLQFSQAATINDVPPQLRGPMDSAGPQGVLPDGKPYSEEHPMPAPQQGVQPPEAHGQPAASPEGAPTPANQPPNTAVQPGGQAPVPAPARRGLDSEGARRQTK